MKMLFFIIVSLILFFSLTFSVVVYQIDAGDNGNSTPEKSNTEEESKNKPINPTERDEIIKELNYMYNALTTKWSRIDSKTLADLRGVWGTDSNNVYAVGYDHAKGQGVILHFDGTIWSKMDGGADNLLHAVWGAPARPDDRSGGDANNIYAVGYSPYDIALLKYDGVKWEPLVKRIGPVFLHGIGGINTDNILVIGYTQGGGWCIVKLDEGKLNPIRLPEVKHSILRGIWSVDKEFFIVGSYGVIIHYDGTDCQVMNSNTTKTLQGIWGTSKNNIYAVGEEGTILHFDGKSWTSMKSNTTAFLNGIWGKSAAEIYAVGQNGTILQYDGTQWQNSPPVTNAFLQAIWGDKTNGKIFIVGTDGTILVYSPAGKTTSFSPKKDPTPSNEITLTLFKDAIIPPQGVITKSAEVEFPAGKWGKIELSVELIAINDAWDRIFTMSVSHADGDVEIDRSMTDWGYSYAYTRDVTPYGGLFKGKRKVTATLSGLSSGWRLNAKLRFYPGTPAENPFEIVPLWNWMIMEKNPQATPPINTSAISKKVKIPAGCSSGEIVLFATGHSPEGRGAEEFGPPRDINIKYDGQIIKTVKPWRENPTDAHGTKFPRSGWMPKDKVDHFVIKIPESLIKSGEHEVVLEIPEVTRYWVVSAALVLYNKK